MKFLYEKLLKENNKLTEKHNKEMEIIIAQKLESDDTLSLSQMKRKT